MAFITTLWIGNSAVLKSSSQWNFFFSFLMAAIGTLIIGNDLEELGNGPANPENQPLSKSQGSIQPTEEIISVAFLVVV